MRLVSERKIAGANMLNYSQALELGFTCTTSTSKLVIDATNADLHSCSVLDDGASGFGALTTG